MEVGPRRIQIEKRRIPGEFLLILITLMTESRFNTLGNREELLPVLNPFFGTNGGVAYPIPAES